MRRVQVLGREAQEALAGAQPSEQVEGGPKWEVSTRSHKALGVNVLRAVCPQLQSSRLYAWRVAFFLFLSLRSENAYGRLDTEGNI